VALRTQQILAHETGVTRVADPLGGSWFIEHLTDTMEQGALEYIAEIDGMGDQPSRGQTPNGQRAKEETRTAGVYAPRRTYTRGVVNGINRGYFRRQIAEASYRFSEECEAGDRIIVGVNAYTEGNEDRSIEILQISHDVEVQQNARLADFKKRRDATAVATALDNIRAACQGKPVSVQSRELASALGGQHGSLHPTNVMPALVDGALANCTLGEMVQAMADVYGRYTGGPEW
jgi:methylmalonyl-CoA mutase N-terminal domain/subunit